MVKQARSIVERGFKIIKVKLGDDGKKDVERIRVIRECVGSNIKIRIDANQGWTIDEAIKTLKKINKYEIQYCEAPINREFSYRLNEVKEAIETFLVPFVVI